MNREARRDSTRIAVLIAGAAAMVLAIALGQYATPSFPGGGPGGRPMARLPPPPADLPTLLWQLGVGSTVWYVAIGALPLMLLFARRMSTDRWSRTATAAVVLGTLAGLIVITSTIDYLWTYGTGGPPLAAWIPMSLRQHVLPSVAMVGIVVVIDARRRAVAARVERERLRAQVAEQRLIALTGQLRPHFLFNALQAVSTLIHRDPIAVDQTLTKLSDLLHDSLRHRDSPYVTLAEEANYAKTWLELAKVRFADRLTFEIDVPTSLHHVAVPLFILQPLVENALAHGIGGRIEGGRIIVRAKRDGDRLFLDVIDDGPGPAMSGGRSNGIGLANTRERLRAAFGDHQSLTVEAAPGRGTIARIEIPGVNRRPAEHTA